MCRWCRSTLLSLSTLCTSCLQLTVVLCNVLYDAFVIHSFLLVIFSTLSRLSFYLVFSLNCWSISDLYIFYFEIFFFYISYLNNFSVLCLYFTVSYKSFSTFNRKILNQHNNNIFKSFFFNVFFIIPVYLLLVCYLI